MWPQMMAWAVHLFTACGAVIGVWCLIAIHRGDYRGAFFGMVLAVVFDAVDGPLARLTRVKEILPQFDGAKLDDIVDYLNYVVVPIVLIHEANLLPASVSLWILPLPLLASAYRFCHVSAKTPDHFFTGFPSYWNILVFYYFVGGVPSGLMRCFPSLRLSWCWCRSRMSTPAGLEPFALSPSD